MAEEFEGVVGIDLGTTFSCIAVLQHEKVDVIPNDQGNRTTPSRVGFVTGQTLVGDAAANASMRHPRQVIYDAKRMIGRAWSDPDLQRDVPSWPFTVQQRASDKNGLEIVVNQASPGDDESSAFPTKRLQPEQVSATLLKYLKTCAERHLGRLVKRAVVTVPAYFNDAQRERTRAAGRIAGLDVLRIVNEPTAAALAYGLDKNKGDSQPRNILVFDFGGGTFDVSVIAVDQGTFLVLGTAGHTHLGGQDIDVLLTKFVVSEIKRLHKLDVSDRPKVLAKLRLQAERAKKALSHSTEHTIECDGLLDGDDFELTISRARFEELISAVLKQCMDIVAKALKDVKLSKNEIDDIVLVGGSSRIPRVRQLVSDFFNGRQVNCTMNPDEAIAVGAAIQGAVLSTDAAQQSDRLREVVLVDVVPLSLGVDVDNGRFDVLIPRNHTIPHKATKEFSTFIDYQTEVTVCVYEGLRPLVKHNRLLGSFELEGITKAKKGVPTIYVTFDVDANGILTVTAEEELPAKRGTTAGHKKSLVVKNADRLSKEDVERMAAEAQTGAAEDERIKRALDRLGDFEARLVDASDALEKVKLFRVFHRKGGAKLLTNIGKAIEWMRGPARQMPVAAIEERFERLEQFATKALRLFRRCEANPSQVKARKPKAARGGSDDDDAEDSEADDGEDAPSTSGGDEDSDAEDEGAETVRKIHRSE